MKNREIKKLVIEEICWGEDENCWAKENCACCRLFCHFWLGLIVRIFQKIPGSSKIIQNNSELIQN